MANDQFERFEITDTAVVAKARLFTTAERDELVPEEDPRAAFLFCIPGQRISRQDADRFGLRDEEPQTKQSAVQENKKREPQENK